MPIALLACVLISITPPAENPTPVQIDLWISQLNDPSFEIRQSAVLNLYACGPRVLEDLQEVSASRGHESALQARSIISRIQKLYLVGAQVTLSVSQSSFRWDEPVTLTATIRNPNDFPIHLPFLIHQRESLDQDALSQQIGGILDMADLLVVSTREGITLDPTIDDFRDTPAEESLERRVHEGPESLLRAGESYTLTMEAFNRGHARYRMLQSTQYTVQFRYLPEWDDPQLVKDRVGLVTSNELQLTVTESAPEQILNADRPAIITIRKEDTALILSLTNVHDRPMGFNLNPGPQGSPQHAIIRWTTKSPQEAINIVHHYPDDTPFDVERIRILQPNECAAIAHIPIQDVCLQIRRENDSLEQNATLSASYTNHLDRSWAELQLRTGRLSQADHDRLLEALPVLMFVGQVASPVVNLDCGISSGK